MEEKPTTKPALLSPEQVKSYLATWHTVAVVKVVLGTLCLLFGITSVVLTVPSSGPFSSGSGITSGFVTILAGIFEMLLIREGNKTSPSKVNCLLLTVRVFFITGLHLGLLNFANGIWALVTCSNGNKDEHCGGIHWSANIVTAAAHLVFGLTFVVLFTLGIRLYVKTAKTLLNTAKVHNEVA